LPTVKHQKASTILNQKRKNQHKKQQSKRFNNVRKKAEKQKKTNKQTFL